METKWGHGALYMFRVEPGWQRVHFFKSFSLQLGSNNRESTKQMNNLLCHLDIQQWRIDPILPRWGDPLSRNGIVKKTFRWQCQSIGRFQRQWSMGDWNKNQQEWYEDSKEDYPCIHKVVQDWYEENFKKSRLWLMGRSNWSNVNQQLSRLDNWLQEDVSRQGDFEPYKGTRHWIMHEYSLGVSLDSLKSNDYVIC